MVEKDQISEEEFNALPEEERKRLTEQVVSAIRSTQEVIVTLNETLRSIYREMGKFDFVTLEENFRRLDEIEYESLLTPQNAESYRIARLLATTGREINDKLNTVVLAYAKNEGGVLN